jgi:FKBP-type peptidyl-prolyl cis-trans isomerase (trigger factor)
MTHEPKTDQLRLEPELRERLERLARQEQRPISNLVRRIISRDIAAREPDRRVRLGLVLAEIDQKNNIKVTDEERVLPRSPG